MDFAERFARCPAPLALALAVLALPRAADAQVMEEVTITAAPPDATDDTASQGTVAPADLEEFPTYRPGELLETVPGLIVTQHSAEGKANQYFMRGFNLDHGTDIDLSVDGMPVNMPTNAHGQGYSDLNFMIPELIGGIDYSKGPYFAGKGDFDTAGAVSIDYVDALPKDMASLSAGTLGNGRAFAAMSRPWGGGGGTGNFLIASEYDHLDGPWQIPDNFNKGNLVLRYSNGAPDNGFSLTGMFMDDAWHATNQIPERAVESGIIDLYGPLDPTDGGTSERYSLSGTYAATDAAGQFKANAYAIGYELKLFNNFDGYVLFPPPIGDQFEQQERRQVVGGAASYTAYSTLLGRKSDDTLGFETRTDFNHMGLDETTDDVIRFTVRDDRILEATGGLYAENRTEWSDWFRTIAGVRGDLFHGQDTSAPIAANSGTDTKPMLSPKLNTIFGPWQKTEFYLSYGQGFHSNDLRGALSSIDALATEVNQQGGSSTIVTQAKTPFVTKAEGYEAGVRTTIVPNVSASAALFVLNLANEATFDGDEAVTSVGRPSNRTGIELSATYAPLDWLSVNGDFAFTRARFTAPDDGLADVEPGHPGDYIPEAAKVIASAEIAVQNLGPWDGGLRFRYFGPRPLIEDGTERSGPTALFDARIGYRFTEVWRAELDVFNLFNSRAHQIDYFYATQLLGETKPTYGIQFKPVEPLSARLTLAARF